MSTMNEATASAALRLRQAEAERKPIDPLRTAFPENDLDVAYAIQNLNTDRALADGRRLVGRKIGLTAKAVQRQLGVDQPDYGMLFADMEVEDGGTASLSRLIQPRVEAEIAFVMARALTSNRPTMADIINAVDYALPALEIVDSRIAGWDIRIVDTVADNASSGLFVLGTTPKRIGDIDLRLAGMALEQNGTVASVGSGAACLGHPLIALQWLARKMADVGRPLAEGDIVLSGALGPMVAAAAGQDFVAGIGGLGHVRVSFR